MWSRPAKQGRSAKRTTAARTRENPEQISKQYLQRHVKITGIPDTQVFGKFVCWLRIGDAMTHRVRFLGGNNPVVRVFLIGARVLSARVNS